MMTAQENKTIGDEKKKTPVVYFKGTVSRQQIWKLSGGK